MNAEVFSTPDKEFIYIKNDIGAIEMPRGNLLPTEAINRAIIRSHIVLKTLADMDIDIFALLGMRNLSAFVGEVFSASLIKETGDTFRKNPHQDGYPDLLLMDSHGAAEWVARHRQLRDKAPFSPFATGGLEVKATCGSVPTPAQLAPRGIDKPDIGDQRISLVRGYDWKAHHRQTNNLIGLFWDFVHRKPTIVAVFYSAELNEADWGEIVQPREGGGRTTSVSIMRRSAIKKMFNNWITVIDDPRYIAFFERYNGGVMRRAA